MNSESEFQMLFDLQQNSDQLFIDEFPKLKSTSYFSLFIQYGQQARNRSTIKSQQNDEKMISEYQARESMLTFFMFDFEIQWKWLSCHGTES